MIYIDRSSILISFLSLSVHSLLKSSLFSEVEVNKKFKQLKSMNFVPVLLFPKIHKRPINKKHSVVGIRCKSSHGDNMLLALQERYIFHLANSKHKRQTLQSVRLAYLFFRNKYNAVVSGQVLMLTRGVRYMIFSLFSISFFIIYFCPKR